MRVHDIITGLPRSGTTLVARIVAAARPDAMLLGEPVDLLELLARRAFARGEFAAVLHGYLEARLAAAQRQGSYLDRRLPNLGVPDNYHGISARAVDFRSVPLPPGGCSSVICKNNEIFTSLAREIAAHPGLRLLRVVRHPAGAISSWRRWQIPAREGRSPEAESWSPELVQRLDAAADCSERQAILYGFLLRAIAAPGITWESGLLRYEDLVRGSPLPPPHEHCPTLPFLKPTGGNTPQLSPQHTADFLQTLQRLDPAAAALLEEIFKPASER